MCACQVCITFITSLMYVQIITARLFLIASTQIPLMELNCILEVAWWLLKKLSRTYFLLLCVLKFSLAHQILSSVSPAKLEMTPHNRSHSISETSNRMPVLTGNLLDCCGNNSHSLTGMAAVGGNEQIRLNWQRCWKLTNSQSSIFYSICSSKSLHNLTMQHHFHHTTLIKFKFTLSEWWTKIAQSSLNNVTVAASRF